MERSWLFGWTFAAVLALGSMGCAVETTEADDEAAGTSEDALTKGLSAYGPLGTRAPSGTSMLADAARIDWSKGVMNPQTIRGSVNAGHVDKRYEFPVLEGQLLDLVVMLHEGSEGPGQRPAGPVRLYVAGGPSSGAPYNPTAKLYDFAATTDAPSLGKGGREITIEALKDGVQNVAIYAAPGTQFVLFAKTYTPKN